LADPFVLHQFEVPVHPGNRNGLPFGKQADEWRNQVIAERAGISTALIQDAGMTEIPPGTITALGLGPAKSVDLDKITGSLSLL